jgi:restriction endonuclease NotI
MVNGKKAARAEKTQYRFGIAEWYGKSFVLLTGAQRRRYAEEQFQDDLPVEPCPFLSENGRIVQCWKRGGVCSLRMYQQSKDGSVTLDERGSTIRTLCPSRFEQSRTIYSWIGSVLLEDPSAVPIGQINFLEHVPLIGATEADAVSQEDVGRIDNVLVVPNSVPLRWCPVEIQAVYFSGKRMALDFMKIRNSRDDALSFPTQTRRPDYRSSGPKRLMPQLQVKVPTLRRWGKKMAVVVDEDFFGAMGQMEQSNDVSNCDVAWFVVRYRDTPAGVQLEQGRVFLTGLEDAVKGLIAGVPVSQNRFEEKIRTRLAAR